MSGNATRHWDISTLATGSYLLRLTGHERAWTTQLVKTLRMVHIGPRMPMYRKPNALTPTNAMRTRISLFLLGMGLLAGPANAQPPRIVVQGAGAPQVFSSINAALTAAQPNDKVYLSGGTHLSPTSIIIEKELHFIGAGIGPDSTAATGITTISTQAGNIVLTTAAGGSTFTGIIFSPAGVVQYGTTAADDDPRDLLFQRCTFTTAVDVATSNTNPALPSSTDFKECVFYSNFYGANGAVATLERCIIDHNQGTGASVSGFDGGGLTLRHCVVMEARIGNSAGFTSENSVYTRTSAPFWQSSGAILINNLLVSTALVSNMTPGASSTGNVTGVVASSIFINEADNNFTWADDLHLQATSAGVGMATDGSDVGIFGSATPFKPAGVPFNPHVSSAVVGSSTNANSELPVNITVVAQPN